MLSYTLGKGLTSDGKRFTMLYYHGYKTCSTNHSKYSIQQELQIYFHDSVIFLYCAGHSKQLTFAPIFLTVDGRYGNWSLNSTCNATCGQGFETWSRACNNPEPKYGGRNCSHLGKHVALKRCTAKPCPGELGLENNSSYDTKIFQLLPRYFLSFVIIFS